MPRDCMGTSKNRGTPKSSILIGFSTINHPLVEDCSTSHVGITVKRRKSRRNSLAPAAPLAGKRKRRHEFSMAKIRPCRGRSVGGHAFFEGGREVQRAGSYRRCRFFLPGFCFVSGRWWMTVEDVEDCKRVTFSGMEIAELLKIIKIHVLGVCNNMLLTSFFFGTTMDQRPQWTPIIWN